MWVISVRRLTPQGSRQATDADFLRYVPLRFPVSPAPADCDRTIMGLGRDENARVRWTWLVAVGEMSRWFEVRLLRSGNTAEANGAGLPATQSSCSDLACCPGSDARSSAKVSHLSPTFLTIRVRAQSLVCLDLFFSDDSAPALWDAYRDAVVDRMLAIFPQGPIYVSEQIMRIFGTPDRLHA